ncbi:MAG: 2-oxoglutarate dehydrogenase complex dihydrolipoyllysine-residue succinyltransferase [Bacteroidia bacterium]|nr:2-oxoglutarate dehydrogenase complex dihydrolipoyllysine-residue succinyltransferase [Bacteroidia bacterium]
MIIEVKVPSPGESITEVEIRTWLVADGDFVEMDSELVEINSDKATLTVNAEDDGVIHIKAKDGDTVAVGDVIATIDTSASGGASKPKEEAVKAPETKEVAVQQPAEVKSFAAGVPSPSAEKLMKEKGMDAGSIEGTGRGGRVTKTDVLTHTPAAKTAPAADNGKEKAAAQAPVATPSMSGSRDTRREKMSMLRRKIADRLVTVKNETAMLTTFNEVDMFEIKALRDKYKDKFKEKHGVGLGFMSFFSKAVTEAIKFYPGINAQIDGQEIVYHDYVDLGIAVSTGRGLVVPCIRNAEQLTFAQIEQAIMAYALKARENAISIDDMTGGTFTITNGGIFGSMLSTPILNPPQSAILGMHNIVDRPVAINGEVKIRPIMYLALSYDHRIVDGKEAVSFLYKVKEFLEDPARLLFEV